MWQYPINNEAGELVNTVDYTVLIGIKESQITLSSSSSQALRRKPASRSMSISSSRSTWRRASPVRDQCVTSWSLCWLVFPETRTLLSSRRRSTFVGSETTFTTNRISSRRLMDTSIKLRTIKYLFNICSTSKHKKQELFPQSVFAPMSIFSLHVHT